MTLLEEIQKLEDYYNSIKDKILQLDDREVEKVLKYIINKLYEIERQVTKECEIEGIFEKIEISTMIYIPLINVESKEAIEKIMSITKIFDKCRRDVEISKLNSIEYDVFVGKSIFTFEKDVLVVAVRENKIFDKNLIVNAYSLGEFVEMLGRIIGNVKDKILKAVDKL